MIPPPHPPQGGIFSCPRPSPRPLTHRQQPRPQVHSARPQGRQPQPPTGPAEGKPPPHARRPAADPRPQLDHPPKAPRPEARPQPPPPTIPRKRPRSTRPEALFLHPSPAGSGKSPRHQPHINARSASSAIPRRITSAHFAPATAPFLRLLRHSPSPSAKPVSTVLPSSRYLLAISSALIS